MRNLPGLGKKTLVMGILNLTPDSFSDGGLYYDKKTAFLRARQIEEDGADILDIGGESTRPGSESVKLEDEIDRVIPLIRKLKKTIRIPISIDTSKSEVARLALEYGASMVNDVTGLRGDSSMASVAARYKAPVVIMHMKGLPRTMQVNPKYRNLIPEIISNLKEGIRIARSAGIDKDKIIIDPGIGFGKRTRHNLQILDRLSEFKKLGYALLIGTSRKSFIGNILDLPVDMRLMGTAATVAVAIYNGADIIRVHDVKEMVQVARMVDAIVGRASRPPRRTSRLSRRI